MNVVDSWASIGYQEILKIGNLLRKQSRPPRGPFLILRSKKLPIKIENLGSS